MFFIFALIAYILHAPHAGNLTIIERYDSKYSAVHDSVLCVISTTVVPNLLIFANKRTISQLFFGSKVAGLARQQSKFSAAEPLLELSQRAAVRRQIAASENFFFTFQSN